MRVIAGEARGTTLRGPTTEGTRPMADRIKGALFSSLGSMGIEPDRVLDLYAGTGSVGIEALSRGATWVEFVERHAPAVTVIRENLRRTHNSALAEVHSESVESFLRRRGRGRAKPFDLVVLDPPYADAEIVGRIGEVATSGVLAPGGVVVVGHASRVELPDRIGPLERFRHRCHGDSCFSLYDRPDEEQSTDGTDDARDADTGTDEPGPGFPDDVVADGDRPVPPAAGREVHGA